MTEAAIRRAGLRDCAHLAALHAACFDDAWDVPAFEALLTKPGVHAFLATCRPGADVAEAFAVVRVAGGECEILTLGTQPASRRAGLARALVRAAAGAASAEAMFLEVAADNAAARALYDGLGFSETGIRRGYYRAKNGALTDALILRAKLPLSR